MSQQRVIGGREGNTGPLCEKFLIILPSRLQRLLPKVQRIHFLTYSIYIFVKFLFIKGFLSRYLRNYSSSWCLRSENIFFYFENRKISRKY